MMKYLLLVVIAFTAATSEAAITFKDSSYQINIFFKNVAGDEPLQLGNTYSNPFNEVYTVRRFKYYISNFSFYSKDGTVENVPAYFLINQEDTSSANLILSVRKSNFSSMSFLIGVDSLKNVSGIQTGALDPIAGMFWTWNSGYITAKLEATSPLSRSPDNEVSYHIGGFRPGQNSTRRVTLPFPEKLVLQLNNRMTNRIIIAADVNKWFKGAHDLKITDHAVCTTPGALAMQFADNYSGMFTLVTADN